MTADNRVASLFGGPAPADPVPEIIAMCERLLERAKSGDLRALAYAAASRTAGGTIGHGWEVTGGEWFALAAAVLALHTRISNDLAKIE